MKPITISVCRGSACFANGGDALLRSFESVLGITEGETTVDGKFELKTAPCLRTCTSAPCTLPPLPKGSRGRIPEAAALEKSVQAFLKHILEEKPAAPFAQTPTVAPAAFGAPSILLRNENADANTFATLKRLLTERARADAIETLRASGLRGRSGSGTLAAEKLARVNASSGETALLVNAHGGEPGHCGDQVLLEHEPHGVLENALLAAWMIHAKQIFFYLNPFAAPAEKSIRAASEEFQTNPLYAKLGCAIDFIRGNGAYVSGEASAACRAIEGKPPLPVAEDPATPSGGIHGRPTVVFSAETLQNFAWILEHGAEAFRNIGTQGSPGTKLVTLSGLVQNPGVYEVPFGVSIRRIVEEHGGGMSDGSEISTVLAGGPLGTLLQREQLDTPLSFEAFAAKGWNFGHGSLTVFHARVPPTEIARHCLEFASIESCGNCTPCRVGTFRAVEALRRMPQDPAAHATLAELAETLKHASLCNFGKMAGAVIRPIGK